MASGVTNLRYAAYNPRALRKYFAYLESEVCAIVDRFEKEPGAVDTASRYFFARFEPETRHIDTFLLDLWSRLQQSDQTLPIPEWADLWTVLRRMIQAVCLRRVRGHERSPSSRDFARILRSLSEAADLPAVLQFHLKRGRQSAGTDGGRHGTERRPTARRGTPDWSGARGLLAQPPPCRPTATKRAGGH